MRSYETSTPRAAVGLMAVAMTAITMGVLVVIPAIVEADSRERGMIAASQNSTSSLTSAVTDAAIDFVEAHEVITVPCPASMPEAEDRSALQDAVNRQQPPVATRSGADSEPRMKRTL